ncbi:MAG: carbohydrate binding family 9 domain-containing protein [Cyclobacteriaceae bacterium]|nr:carbohydrate binding family 9 domain-containing protein [Cyclobacteriaceae bacterium]MDH4297356.1 carbohydrate binding family 9 domain-containing protein [Cyclobacteriaceae bacterium]MDH5248179.1 carbohydrate binding family 9 domain-containing protein [Cyclobacteriaceae bacterium]
MHNNNVNPLIGRFLFGVSLFLSTLSFAQHITIKKATGKIILDGVIDEQDWNEADVARDFKQNFPMDTALAAAQTEARILYDDQFIYVSAKMYNLGPRAYVTPSLRRDYRGAVNDGFTVVFDTFQDRTNAFVFGINPFGVQREGLISNGGDFNLTDFTLNWDNKWFGEAKIYDDCWIVEIAIPFKTLRYKAGLDTWNINFYRIDSQYAERSTWSPIPQNFDLINLAFLRQLKWDKPLPKGGPNISVIPYLAANRTQDFEKGSSAEQNLQVGGDVKIAVSSALNLDLTVNPDFSQVEVDQQVTNLDRFEIFFPERRQFFLENADLFANFGVEETRPFFSRRIGVARDSSTGQNIQNPIYFGARLSGKIDNNTRIGILNTQAGEDRSIGLPSTNYTVATVQRKVFSRSYVGLIAINKQAFQDSIGGEFTMQPKAYNRLLGADFNLATNDNIWSGKLFYHHSFDEAKLDSAFAYGGLLNYNTNRWSIQTFMRSVGANFNPEAGFVRRKNIQQLTSMVSYKFYPAYGKVQRHGPGFNFDMVGNGQYKFLDWNMVALYNIRWKSTAIFELQLRREYIYLFDEFDPSGTNGQRLQAGTDYTNNLILASYISDARKRFFFTLKGQHGGYYNGQRSTIEGTLTYRYQPWGFVSLDFSYNGIRLPKPYSSANLLLIGPRVDITFSRKVFWTTFLQYNSQISNLNINSRLQWRFKPVSDFFLVYTDNYFAESFENGHAFYIGAPKARAIVLKFSYWLNL